MPVSRTEKHGDKAWEECYLFRMISSVFVLIMIINIILWLLYPVPELSWILFSNNLIGVIIGIAIIIPCTIIVIKAVKDGGKEHMKPLKDTKLHGGIYQHIRHPGLIGEMPCYIGIGFFINSIFIIVLMVLFVMLYSPIYIHFEDMDLEKRFGDVYRQYKKRTGALIPKFWRK